MKRYRVTVWTHGDGPTVVSEVPAPTGDAALARVLAESPPEVARDRVGAMIQPLRDPSKVGDRRREVPPDPKLF